MLQKFAFLLFLSFQLFVLGFVVNNDLDINYDEYTARRFFDLAAASQLGVDSEALRQQCFDRSWSDYKYQTKVVQSAVCDNNGNQCQMYIAYSAVKNNYVISFRGITGLSQLITEGFSSLNKYETFGAGTYNGPGSVNHYFYESVRSLWPTIRNNLAERNASTTFSITGHSLGGALASITAAQISLEGYASSNTKIQLFTFGQPRTWDYQATEAFKTWVPYTWRLVHYKDPIPHEPPLSGNGKGKPYHHVEEIWYNDKFTSYTRCSISDGEDATCSDSLGDIKLTIDSVNKEHLVYFGLKVTDYGNAGCRT